MSHLNATVEWDGEDFVCRLDDGELRRVTKALGWGPSVYAAINGFWAALRTAYNEIEENGCGSYSYPDTVEYTYDDSSMYMLYYELIKYGGMPKVGSITAEQCRKYARGEVTPRPDTLDRIRDAIYDSDDYTGKAKKSSLAKDYHYNYEIDWNECDCPQSTQQIESEPAASSPAEPAPSTPTSFASGNRKGGDTFLFDGTVPLIQMEIESSECLKLYIVPIVAFADIEGNNKKSIVQILKEFGLSCDFTEAKLNTSDSIQSALDLLNSTFGMEFTAIAVEGDDGTAKIKDTSLPLNHLVAPKASLVSKLASKLASGLPYGFTTELTSQLTSKMSDYIGEELAEEVVNKGKGLLKSLFKKK